MKYLIVNVSLIYKKGRLNSYISVVYEIFISLSVNKVELVTMGKNDKNNGNFGVSSNSCRRT